MITTKLSVNEVITFKTNYIVRINKKLLFHNYSYHNCMVYSCLLVYNGQ